MKTMRVVFWLSLCTWSAACGNSTTATSTDDAVVGDQDATGSDALGNDTAGSDVQSGDTIGGDGTPTDTMSYKYNTCAAITDCAQAACANSTASSCASECIAGGAPAALPTATALLTCVQAQCVEGQCKGSTDTGCMADCTSLRCMPKIFDCIEDGKTGTGGCGDVKTCFDTCNAGKTNVMSCLQTCYEKISAAGKAAAKPFADCMATAPNNGDPTAACMKETFGCFVDGKTGPKGCYDSMGCLSACSQATDQFGCAIACFGQMTQAGQNAYVDVAPCLGKDITATAGCEDKLVVCLAPTGTQTCEEALVCVMGCGNGGNDPTCMFSCLHNTTSDADKFLFSKIGCDQSDPACSASMIQCIAPNGTATCPAVIGCAMGCSGGPGQSPDIKCVMACVKKGSTATATTAYAMLNCMGKSAPGCVDTAVACYNPSGTKDCAQTTTCVQNCYQTGGDVGTCQNGCYSAASVQGFKDFEAWSTCHQACDSTCKSDQACINTCTTNQCPAAKTACTPT